MPNNKLRSIVDMKRPFTFFYSGVEYKTYLDAVFRMGVRNFLISYEYAGGKGAKTIEHYRNMGVKFFVDSGVFTYLKEEEYQSYTKEQWEEHIAKYLAWCEKHQDMVFAIANLDLENLVGSEQVQEWNRNFFEPFMIRTGIPVSFIWHPLDGEKTWHMYCDRYPYVGFSGVSDEEKGFDLKFGLRMLKTAESYGSVCHGMGITRTQLLPQMPFYTVDSTSWKVGLKYGITTVWNGKRTVQVKRGDFETKAVPVIMGYKDVKLDIEKLRDQEMSEMIKANVYPYIKAEKYVQESLKAKMYWLKVSAVKNDTKEITDNFYPSAGWLLDILDSKDAEAHSAEIKDYAKKMNINPDLDTVPLFNMVMDCTVFNNLEDADYYDILTDFYVSTGYLLEVHTDYINSVCADDDERVNELEKFFKDVVAGKEDKLLIFGTNFDRQVKERDTYLEDPEYDVVELSKEEVHDRIAKLLPKPEDANVAPEIDDLDEEIFKCTDIVPVRDKNGRFLKGQTKVRKPKQIYSDKYPKLACDRCHVGASCPEYKAGCVCAYDKLFKRFDTRNPVDIVEAMQGIANLSLQRLQRTAVFESLNHGIPDPAVSNMVDQNMRILSQLQQFYIAGTQEVMKHTRTVNSDGSQQETLQITNPQSGGLLESLFSTALNSRRSDGKEDNDIDTIEV